MIKTLYAHAQLHLRNPLSVYCGCMYNNPFTVFILKLQIILWVQYTKIYSTLSQKLDIPQCLAGSTSNFC